MGQIEEPCATSTCETCNVPILVVMFKSTGRRHGNEAEVMNGFVAQEVLRQMQCQQCMMPGTSALRM